MSLESTTFAGEIRRIAEGLDITPTGAQVGVIETVLQSLAILADDGTVTADLGAGAIGITEAIVDQLERLQLPALQSSPVPQHAMTDRPGALRVGNSVMFGRTDAFADIHRAFQAGEAAATAREVATWPNPWKGEINRTRQNVIINTDPALAARFRAEAIQ